MMGRWAANHDQRKGQWLVNHIRDHILRNILREEINPIESGDRLAKIIELRLWNMSNDEFDKIMAEYYR